MSSFFEPQAEGDVWFRIGKLGVTSTLLVVFSGLVGMLAWVVAPSLPGHLALIPAQVISGEVWRLVTWPFAGTISLWSLLTLLILWMFGTRLEAMVGRNRMLGLFLGLWAVLTATTLLVGFLLPGSTGLGGLDMVEFLILLLFIAEYPRVPFFFGIPAWVIGAILVGVQVLQLIAYRAGGSLLALLLSMAGAALVARRAGLLRDWAWLPGGGGTRRRPRTPARPTRQERREASDEERLDDLLGKISAHGLHSLTRSERSELDKIRERRRRS